MVPSGWRWVLYANPMTGVVEGFRWAILGKPYDVGFLASSIAGSLLILAWGVRYFQRAERRFADII